MSWQSHRRILIIDDNPSIHEDFRKILGAYRPDQSSLNEKEALLFGGKPQKPEQAAFHIDSAHQGTEGLERIIQARDEGQPYSLAFVDVRMPPGWDGVETIEHIFAADSHIQAVICSAYSDYSASDILSTLGVCDRLLMLRKPCDSAEIFLIATAMCEKWKLAQENGHTRRRKEPQVCNLHTVPVAESSSPKDSLAF
jgi:CheY-like chemotaxis protein